MSSIQWAVKLTNELLCLHHLLSTYSIIYKWNVQICVETELHASFTVLSLIEFARWNFLADVEKYDSTVLQSQSLLRLKSIAFISPMSWCISFVLGLKASYKVGFFVAVLYVLLRIFFDTKLFKSDVFTFLAIPSCSCFLSPLSWALHCVLYACCSSSFHSIFFIPVFPLGRDAVTTVLALETP